MKYPRPKYLDPAVKLQSVKVAFTAESVDAPLFDTPITPRENFRRSTGRQNPVWMPISVTDKITMNTNESIGWTVRGMQMHANFLANATEDYEFKD